MITARIAGAPEMLLIFGDGTQVIAIELVEPGAAQVQLLSGGSGGQFIAPKSRKDFTDQRRAQTVWKLAVMFFIAARMFKSQSNYQHATPALRAFRRPPLRSGLLQARRAGGVRLCSQRSSAFTRNAVKFLSCFGRRGGTELPAYNPTNMRGTCLLSTCSPRP